MPQITGVDRVSLHRWEHVESAHCAEAPMRPNGVTSRRQIVLRVSTSRRKEIRIAEVIGSRCLATDLATDLAIELPIEHGPRAPCSRCAGHLLWSG